MGKGSTRVKKSQGIKLTALASTSIRRSYMALLALRQVLSGDIEHLTPEDRQVLTQWSNTQAEALCRLI